MAAAEPTLPIPSTAPPSLPAASPPRPRRGHRLDERLARSAVVWSLDPEMAADDIALRLVDLADGNRTALLRALMRIEMPHRGRLSRQAVGTIATASGRAAAAVRLALTTGRWAW